MDKPGFQALVSHLDSRIDIKTRWYFTRKLEERVNSEIIPALKKELQDIEKRFCHFSCDIWSSRKCEGIFAIVAHFVDNNWELRHKVLLFDEISSRHTGENIRSVFLQCLADYGITSDWVWYTLFPS